MPEYKCIESIEQERNDHEERGVLNPSELHDFRYRRGISDEHTVVIHIDSYLGKQSISKYRMATFGIRRVNVAFKNDCPLGNPSRATTVGSE